jgi:trk system potassium uptake protein TrkA
MAETFRQRHLDVLAVDIREDRVTEGLPYVTNALIGDATNETFMKGLGVSDFDLCVVAIGDNFQSSLEATALLKECGATFVVSRAARDVHVKFLLRNGADDVIFPERQIASWTAVRYSSEHIFDYVELTPEYSIFETDIPPEWVGKTLAELSVRQKYHINILAIKQNGQMDPLPNAAHRFRADDRIFFLGSEKDVQRLLHI